MTLLQQIADLSSEAPIQGMTSQDRLRKINALVVEAMGVEAAKMAPLVTRFEIPCPDISTIEPVDDDEEDADEPDDYSTL